MTLQWNRSRPIPADCRGMWAAAVRDPSRKILERASQLSRGAWIRVVWEHCRSVGKELR